MIKFTELGFAKVLSLAVVLYLAPVSAYAQSAPAADIPNNAHVQSFGSGWRCDVGFREADELCVAVKIPANAFATNLAYGPGWQCRRGYQQSADTCVVLALPEKSHLNFNGNDWECDKPYRKEKSQCVIP